jgi:hypothetical protein
MRIVSEEVTPVELAASPRGRRPGALPAAAARAPLPPPKKPPSSASARRAELALTGSARSKASDEPVPPPQLPAPISARKMSLALTPAASASCFFRSLSTSLEAMALKAAAWFTSRPMSRVRQNWTTAGASGKKGEGGSSGNVTLASSVCGEV